MIYLLIAHLLVNAVFVGMFVESECKKGLKYEFGLEEFVSAGFILILAWPLKIASLVVDWAGKNFMK